MRTINSLLPSKEHVEAWVERVRHKLKPEVTEMAYDQKKGFAHKEAPGFGVAYEITPENKKHERSPDFEGFLVLECDYKAGEKMYMAFWQKPTSRGTTLLSIKENNMTKKKRLEANQPVEVSYSHKPRVKVADDEDIPF